MLILKQKISFKLTILKVKKRNAMEFMIYCPNYFDCIVQVIAIMHSYHLIKAFEYFVMHVRGCICFGGLFRTDL